ncbi:DUF5753 domain-containing protein [Streptomyces sp. NPDC001848]|uniref:DUF5753 domain-containing protein n=1 Tax=Streptomyces sp. NPDC001848 TaxID=3364618 RepID=UPI0036B2E302
MLQSDFPPLDDEEIEQLTQARLERRALLDRKPVCVINVILEEEALRRQIGTAEAMHDQYKHLVACAERPNVVIQVMPSRLGAHAGLRGPMTVVETPEQTSLVYTEALGKSLLVSKPDEVGILARRYAMISRQALRPEESVDAITQLAGEL